MGGLRRQFKVFFKIEIQSFKTEKKKKPITNNIKS